MSQTLSHRLQATAERAARRTVTTARRVGLVGRAQRPGEVGLLLRFAAGCLLAVVLVSVFVALTAWTLPDPGWTLRLLIATTVLHLAGHVGPPVPASGSTVDEAEHLTSA